MYSLEEFSVIADDNTKLLVTAIKQKDPRAGNSSVENQITSTLRTALSCVAMSIKEACERGTTNWSTTRVEKVKNKLHEMNRVIPAHCMPPDAVPDKIERQWRQGTTEMIDLGDISSKTK